MANIHADDDDEKGPSNRNFGLVVGGIFLAIEAIRFYATGEMNIVGYCLLAAGAPLFFFGLVYPPVLTPFNKAWMKLGLLMYKVVNPVIMFLIYMTAIVPVGLILRMSGKDLLRLQKDPDARSYWIERDPEQDKLSSMKNQF
jgi:hypothetical protein